MKSYIIKCSKRIVLIIKNICMLNIYLTNYIIQGMHWQRVGSNAWLQQVICSLPIPKRHKISHAHIQLARYYLNFINKTTTEFTLPLITDRTPHAELLSDPSCNLYHNQSPIVEYNKRFFEIFWSTSICYVIVLVKTQF